MVIAHEDILSIKRTPATKVHMSEATKSANPATLRIPDFIIAGAMKCGTTSMHSILNSHPDIFIPRKEINFFDLDDLIQHPDFFFFNSGRWYYPSFVRNDTEYWNWYSAFFAGATDDQLLGEDSTCYLASEVAPERISKVGKEIKIIIMLRDPADRAYSQYWHLVRTGRATLSFEETLQIEPASVLIRSLYEKQVRNFLRFMPRERIYFVIFEDFIRNSDATTRKVCDYLGVDGNLIDLSQANSHANAGRWPKYANLQLWRNRMLRQRAKFIYQNHLIDVPNGNGQPSPLIKLADKVHATLNPCVKDQQVKMRNDTRAMLDDYFSTQNAGLSKLLDINLDEKWYRSRKNA
jgi:Sulfotransferase family